MTHETSTRTNPSSRASRTRLGFFALALLALAALAAPGLASAALPEHPALGTFCEPTGIGSAPCEPEISTNKTSGMATDQATGDVYVIDLEDQTLHRYNENGTPHNFSAIEGGTSNVLDGAGGAGEDETPSGEILSTEIGANNEAQVSIAPPGSAGGTEGDIYVTNAENNSVDIFAPSGEYLESISAEFACGVSAGPGGDVYVGSWYNGVYKFEPTGPGFTEASGSPFTTTTHPCNVAAGYGPSAGSVIVGDIQGSGTVVKLNASTGAVEDSEVFPGSEKQAFTVDAATGHLYVSNFAEVKEYNISGTTAEEVSSTTVAGVLVQGLAANWATGNLYVSEFSNPNVEVYGPITGHHPLGTFCEPTGIGSAPCEPEISTNKTSGMATDQATGDVYVIDLEDQTLHRYNENGTPHNFSAIEGGTSNVLDGAGGAGEDETPSGEILSTEIGANNEAQVSIAPPGSAGGTEGDIYVTNAENNSVDIFAPSGEYLESISAEFACGVSAGPGGDVYVGSWYNGVYKFEPTGPGFTEASGSPFTTTTHPCNVAAGYGPSAGSVIVGDIQGSGTVVKLNASTGAVEDSDVFPGSEKQAFTVDAATGHLYVSNFAEVKEYNISGTTAEEVSSTTVAGVLVQGLAANWATGNLYVSEFGNPNVEVYAPGPGSQTVSATVTGEGEVSADQGTLSGCTSSGGANCEEERFEGETVTLTATAIGANHFVTWGASPCENASPDAEEECEFEVGSSPIAATAEFEADGFELKVEKEGTGNGTVESDVAGVGSNKIECGSTCTELFAESTVVTLTGTPGSHSEPVEWISGCENSPAPGGSCEVTMSEAKEVKASFTAITHTLGVTVEGSGAAECKEDSEAFGSCAVPFREGHQVTVKDVPAAHWHFVEFNSGTASAEACNGVTADECSFTIEADSVLTAENAETIRSLAINTGGGSGTGQVDCKVNGGSTDEPCATEYLDGTELELIGTPTGGHSLFAGFENGTEAANACTGTSPCTITLEGEGAEVDAPFNLEQLELEVEVTGSGSGEVTSSPRASNASSGKPATKNSTTAPSSP